MGRQGRSTSDFSIKLPTRIAAVFLLLSETSKIIKNATAAHETPVIFSSGLQKGKNLTPPLTIAAEPFTYFINRQESKHRRKLRRPGSSVAGDPKNDIKFT